MSDCALISGANLGHLAEPASQAVSPPAHDLDINQDARESLQCPLLLWAVHIHQPLIRFLSGGAEVKSGL